MRTVRLSSSRKATGLSRGRRRGLSLVEVIVSSMIFVMIAIGALEVVQVANLMSRQSLEDHLAAAFLEDYMENVLGLRYNDIVLSSERDIFLLDGLRELPASYSADAWRTVDDADELAFPDLLQLQKGDIKAEYQVNIQNIDNAINGVGDDYKIVTVRLRWPGVRVLRDNQYRRTLELEARRYRDSVVNYMAR